MLKNLLGGSADEFGEADGDDYEIEREIGRGGSGTVYLARDNTIGRQVAIKVLNSLSGDTNAELRFRAEAEAIAALDHPNIVSVFAFGDIDGRAFFTMQYVGGGSLDARIGEFSDTRKAAALVEKLARAVHHAHKRGILHRDLKPSNILLDEEGEPIVSDFGIAKRADEQGGLTITGAVMGTPNYMSPEQARGESGRTTTATDVFSLGTILFELLNGRKAFDGSSPHTVMSKVIDSDVTFTRSESTRLHRDLMSICLKCLEKAPERRYASALDLANDLCRWAKGDPVEARHISGGERAWRWMRRRPVLVGALGLAAMSMVAGTTVSMLQSREANTARVAAEESAYFASLSSAMSARERSNFGEAMRHLSNCPEHTRDRFGWRLVNALITPNHVWRTDFDRGTLLHLTHNRASGELMLLTRDRKVHYIGADDGSVVRVADLPETSRTGLSQFGCSDDGKHYFFVEGGELVVVANPSGETVHRAAFPSGGSVVWLEDDRILYAMAPVEVGAWLPEQTAWTYRLSTGETTALRDKRWTGPIAMSADRRFVALVRMDKKVVVYETDNDFSGEPVLRILAEDPRFKELAFSGNTKSIAIHAGGTDSLLHLYDLFTGEKVFEDYWPRPSSISITTGTHDVVATEQESLFIRCRGLGAGARLKLVDDEARANFYTKKSNDDGPVSPPPRSFVNSPTGARKTSVLAHGAPIVSLMGVPGEGVLFTASRDGGLRRWHTHIPSVFPLRHDDIDTRAGGLPLASPNGEHVAFQSGDGHARRWTRSAPHDAVIPRGYHHLAVFDDGDILTRADSGGDIVCWRAEIVGDDKPQPSEIWRVPSGQAEKAMLSSAITPDGRSIAALFKGGLMLIDVASRTVVEREVDGGGSISICRDGQKIAIAGMSNGGSLLFKSADLESAPVELLPEARHAPRDTVCCFDGQGDRLLIGNQDGLVRVVDLVSMSELRAESWHAHSQPISALAVSQRGDLVATAGGASIALWSTEIDEGDARRFRLGLHIGTGARNWLQFCGDDQMLIHTAPDRPLEVLEAPRVE